MPQENSGKDSCLDWIRAAATDVDACSPAPGFGGVLVAKRGNVSVSPISWVFRRCVEQALNSPFSRAKTVPLSTVTPQKIHIQHAAKGCRDEASVLPEFAAAVDVVRFKTFFIGDDVNDLTAMRTACYAAAPANASRDVLPQSDFILQRTGGKRRRPRVDRSSAGRAWVARGKSLRLTLNYTAADPSSWVSLSLLW
jgi:hypothetical protein